VSTGPLDFELKPLGDTALLARLKYPPGVEGPYQLDATTRYNRLLAARRFAQWLEKVAPDREFVAGYDSVLIPYNPHETSFKAVAAWVQAQLEQLQAADAKPGEDSSRLHRIPVVYGGEYGPDLPEVASLKGLTVEEVIRIHSSATYSVYLIGFSPGFAYLGALPSTIDVPRRSNPRPRVPQGTVALAAGLTGVYPAALPGGWNLIGYTPLSMFESESNPPVRFLPGDHIQFFPITPAELPQYEIHRRDLTTSLLKPEITEAVRNASN
jgi:inhibitor of KinA